MAMKRCCDWCGNPPVFSFSIPHPAGAVVPDEYTHIDACVSHAEGSLHHLANMLHDRPYPTEIGFSVVDA